jgi:hypothetical protein
MGRTGGSVAAEPECAGPAGPLNACWTRPRRTGDDVSRGIRSATSRIETHQHAPGLDGRDRRTRPLFADTVRTLRTGRKNLGDGSRVIALGDGSRVIQRGPRPPATLGLLGQSASRPGRAQGPRPECRRCRVAEPGPRLPQDSQRSGSRLRCPSYRAQRGLVQRRR